MPPGTKRHPPHRFCPDCVSSPMPLPLSTPTFGWLLCPPIKRRPSKAKGPPISLLIFVHQLMTKATIWRPPAHSVPVTSPLRCPPPIVVTDYWLIVAFRGQTSAIYDQGTTLPFFIFNVEFKVNSSREPTLASTSPVACDLRTLGSGSAMIWGDTGALSMEREESHLGRGGTAHLSVGVW